MQETETPLTNISIPGLPEAIPLKPQTETQADIDIFLTSQGLARRVQFFDSGDSMLPASVTAHLQEKGIPYIANGEHSPIRAEDREDAQERSAVVALRIEADPEKVNDNLSSLAKVGMRALQALIYGQRVVVSIEAGFEESLGNDAGALAQYEALRVKLDMLRRKYPSLINVQYASDEQSFLRGVEYAMKAQELPQTANRPLTEIEFRNFATERSHRLSKKNRYVTMGGSSSAYSRKMERQFKSDQDLIAQVLGENSQLTRLNEGFFKSLWEAAYAAGLDQKQRLELMRTAFLVEQGPKNEADVLVWLIQSESVSKAAITEIGFLLLNAFENGQQLILLLEPFDADEYLRQMMKKGLAELKTEFPNEPLLKQIEEQPDSVTFEMVGKSALAASSQYKDADSAKKVRESIEHELEDVKKTVSEITGQHSIELFSLSKDVSDCIQQARHAGSPEAAEGRAEFHANFDKFKKNFKEIVSKNKGQKGKVVELVNQAMSETVELGPFAEPLKQHLAEATATAKMLAPFVTGEKSSKPGSPYLSKEYMGLLADVVTPLHDVLKFLGKPDSQAMRDHEALMAYIANEFFEELGFSPEEVDFISKVIGNHENIFKEEGRDKYAASSNVNEKGMALFFLVDSLTGAIHNQDGKLALDPAKLESRFTDLYVRHMDPVTRKISLPRPEWGLHTVKDYIATCKVLKEQHGVEFSDTFMVQIVDAALEGIKKTFEANGKRADDAANTLPTLTNMEIIKILESKDELLKIKASL